MESKRHEGTKASGGVLDSEDDDDDVKTRCSPVFAHFNPRSRAFVQILIHKLGLGPKKFSILMKYMYYAYY